MNRDRKPSAGTRATRAIVAASTLLAVIGTASAADDAGVRSFFSSQASGYSASAGVAPGPAAQAPRVTTDRAPTRARPLTVRMHPRTPSPTRMALVPTKPDKVSIYEDRTLRRGDAVMTVRGMRIFVGSNSWPYRDDDFVAVSNAGKLDSGLQKTLLALDSLPRN